MIGQTFMGDVFMIFFNFFMKNNIMIPIKVGLKSALCKRDEKGMGWG